MKQKKIPMRSCVVTKERLEKRDLIIILRSIKISIKAPDNFAKFLTFGIIFQLSFQTLLNLAVVVGLVPVTGVTLPFFSYGGSSLIITLISIGIILNISRYREN